jgi:hypothetical protein
MGELLASVNAGEDATYQLKPGESVPLTGGWIDNGIPGDIIDIKWETIPGATDANAVIVDETALLTTATFPKFGTYTLRLSVTDVNLGMAAWDEVTLTIVSPTCADVISEGLLLPGDISGPDGTPDCRVDLADFAAFAIDWLRCVDPQGDCEDPWDAGYGGSRGSGGYGG